MSDFQVTGRCSCGAIVYRVTAPAKSLEHCHCSNCRRAHGALNASGALVDTSHFHLDQWACVLKSHSSSHGNHRWFCSHCGCQIYMSIDHVPSEVYYWAASLDEGMHPGHPRDRECHIFVGSKASWDRFDRALARHDTTTDNIGPGLD